MKRVMRRMWYAVRRDLERYGLIESICCEVNGFERYSETLVDELRIETVDVTTLGNTCHSAFSIRSHQD